MTQYIDKDAVIAEIGRRIEEITQTISLGNKKIQKSGGNRKAELVRFLSFIITLEVKEMNEEPVSEELEEAIEKSFIYHENHGDDFRSDKQIETAYMYGFETGAKWANKHLIEVKEVDLNKEIKDYFHNQPIITRSKGVDYRLIPSGEEIAKHFFEVGLKVAQKGE